VNEKVTMLKTHERIITAQDLAQGVSTALTNARRQPLVITDGGRPAAYLLSVELFDDLMMQLAAWEESEMVDAISVAEDQFAAGAYKTLEQARAIAEAAWKAQESNE
jgi:PHD/YefM family antitoxin component YafN of YafNO toxin-antitoxin module